MRRIWKTYGIPAECGKTMICSIKDKIFTLNHVMGLCSEGGLELHIAFIDCKQAFDRVNRSKLYEAMKQIKLPLKLRTTYT